MKSGRMKRILLSVIAFLFVGCSIAGGTVLLSNTSIKITKNAPTNSDLWTNGHYATAFDNEGEAGIDGTTEEKAYEIRTAEQLALLAYRINTSSTNSTYRSLYYVQTADIDLSLHYWDAIGTLSYYFSGAYDGGGYEIFGMYTVEDGDYQGLFGYVHGLSSEYANIHNVSVVESQIKGNIEYCASIVAYAYYTNITECYSDSKISSTGIYVGGVIGYADTSCNIINCYNTGAVTGRSNVGGVAGCAFIITNCYNDGDIECNGGNVGGVVGRVDYDDCSINDCYNTGTITGNSSGAGGVAGIVFSGDFSNCGNNGDIHGQYAGGLIGWAFSSSTYDRLSIINCYNTGTVDGKYHAGGITGKAFEGCYIESCFNTGDVDGGHYTGGVVGETEDYVQIKNCYNTGDIHGYYFSSPPTYTGGIAGCYADNIINCYNIGTITEGDSVGGIVGFGYNIYNCFNMGSIGGRVTFASGIAASSDGTYKCYYGGNCTTTDYYASNDQNLIANAKSLSWYQDSSKWNSSYPWDFENVWTFVEGMNDGYPVLRGFSTKITYNSNTQPEEVVSESFSVGTTVVLAEADLFEREGYSISSWNTVADGSGVSYAPGATYTGSSVTLYAQWEAKIIQINLDKDGGSGGTSTIYLKYDSGWYTSSSCTSSSKITSLPSTPTRTGYEFKGYNTEPDGSGTLAVSATGAINVSDTFYSTDGTRTWYAVWEARNPAYFDSEGGYWYVENGKLPQSKVSESLKSTLEGQWGSLTYGDVYYMGVEELADGDLTSDGGMRAKVYNGEEYVKFNGEYYLVEPIRWRLVYSSSQKEGYAVENTSVLATMAEIVFLGSYSSTKIGAGEGYSAESVTMLLKNQVSDDYLVSESREVEIFGTPKDTSTASGSVFVASKEELANFTTSKNNTTGSGVKAGKVSLSDFVKDYLRATGQGEYYFTRDLGDQLNSIFCFNPVGNRTQVKAQQTLGVQFTVKVTEYACISA